jgi:GGDEF domain-containing protein
MDISMFSTMSPILQADGNISNYVSIQQDVTERKRGEQKIHELAFFDQLTGLPNRTLLLDRLHQMLAANAQRHVWRVVVY